jgi:hypothetical protein
MVKFSGNARPDIPDKCCQECQDVWDQTTCFLNRRATHSEGLQPPPQYSRDLRVTFEKFLTNALARARYRLPLSLLFFCRRMWVGHSKQLCQAGPFGNCKRLARDAGDAVI